MPSTKTPLERTRHGVRARFTLGEGETATFVVEPVEEAEIPAACSSRVTEDLAHGTVQYWRDWLAHFVALHETTRRFGLFVVDKGRRDHGAAPPQGPARGLGQLGRPRPAAACGGGGRGAPLTRERENA